MLCVDCVSGKRSLQRGCVEVRCNVDQSVKVNIAENVTPSVNMTTGSEQNGYAKKYLGNYKLTATKERGTKKGCKGKNLVYGKVLEGNSEEDMNKNPSNVDEFRSQRRKCSFISQNHQSDSIVQSPSSKKRHKNDDSQQASSAKKVRHERLESEKVTEADGHRVKCGDGEYRAWLAGVVRHDHSYGAARAVRWGEVSVWYFERGQYSCAVPSQGEVGLGMAMSHSDTSQHNIQLLEEEEQDTQGQDHKHKVRIGYEYTYRNENR